VIMVPSGDQRGLKQPAAVGSALGPPHIGAGSTFTLCSPLPLAWKTQIELCRSEGPGQGLLYAALGRTMVWAAGKRAVTARIAPTTFGSNCVPLFWISSARTSLSGCAAR